MFATHWLKSLFAKQSQLHRARVSRRRAQPTAHTGAECLEGRSLMTGWIEYDSSASDGGVSFSLSNARDVEVAVAPNGNPIVAWVDTGTSGGFGIVYVRQFNGTDWVGMDGRSDFSIVSQGRYVTDQRIGLAVHPVTGFPTVAWGVQVDQYNTDREIFLRQWNGTNWVELAGSASGGGLSNTPDRNDMNVQVAFGPASNPGLFVAYEVDGIYINVSKWDVATQTWVGAGGAYSADYSKQYVTPALAVGPDGNPVLAYTQQHSNWNPYDPYGEVMVGKWNGSTMVGLGGANSNGGLSRSQGVSSDFASVAVDRSGNTIVAWNENGSVYVRRFNGTQWLELGGSASGNGLGRGGSPQVTVDSEGRPIVAWTTSGTGPRDNSLLVKRWNGSQWEAFAESGSAFGITPELASEGLSDLAVTAQGEPVVAWIRSHNKDEMVPMVRGFSNSALVPGGLNSGLDFRDSNRFIENKPYEPPNPAVAVGQNHVLQVVNSTVAIFDKTEGYNRFQQHLDAFFEPLASIEPFAGQDITDAVTTYDDIANRFVVAALWTNDVGKQTHLLYAVSKTANPLDGFHMHQIPVTGQQLYGKHLRLGYNADAHVLTMNMFSFTQFQYDSVAVIAIDKASVAQPTPNVKQHRRDQAHYGMIPATMHGATAGGPMWFVEEAGYANGNALRVVRMSNVLSASPAFQDSNLTVASYSQPPLIAQPGQPNNPLLNRPLYVRDASITDVEWRNGRLAATQTVGLNADGLSHARWYEINTATATPSLTQQGTMAPGAGVHTFSPSVAIAANGSVAITYSQSSATEPMSMYVTGRTTSDPLGTMQTPLRTKAGEWTYFTSFANLKLQVASYSGISSDPMSGAFWATSQYAKLLEPASPDFANWGTGLFGFNVTSAAPVYQPDLLVVGGSVYGDNIYNTDGSGQTDNRWYVLRDTMSYAIRLQNDGNTSDSFKLQANSAPSGWTVRYFDAATGGTDITSQVLGSGWTSRSIVAGGQIDLRCEVTVSTSVAPDQTWTPLITATSSSKSSARDAVRVQLTNAIPSPDLHVKVPSEANYTGDNIYNANGVNQSKAQVISASGPAVFQMAVQFDGWSATNETIRLTGSASDARWEIRYFDAPTGGNDITSQMTSTNGWSVSQSLYSRREFRVEMTPRAALTNVLRAVFVTAVHGSNGRRDVVRVDAAVSNIVRLTVPVSTAAPLTTTSPTAVLAAPLDRPALPISSTPSVSTAATPALTTTAAAPVRKSSSALPTLDGVFTSWDSLTV